MVTRLAKGVLPPNTQIQKDAILAMSKGATVFVNYLSNAANEHTIKDNRRTISPQNVVQALHDLEFDAFLPRVEAELAKFNEVQTLKRNDYRRKMKDKEGSGEKGKAPAGEESMLSMDQEGNGSVERAAKRMKKDGGAMSETSEIQGAAPPINGEGSSTISHGAGHDGNVGMENDKADSEEPGNIEDEGQEETMEEEAEDEESASEEGSEEEEEESEEDPETAEAAEAVHSDADSEMLRRTQLEGGEGSDSGSESD